ncbi:minor tail protein [Vibrio phage Aphrodite1]|uniref:Minor tail protein n=1 Tax=Vibrio phage Aphrodite1 TaxID=2070057 RepID=A0A2I7QHP7_9CAUD|nr:minor tail protein [Vibrio phage Aphrodite1]AUR80914.1 minor tail protein [Vibrio phage Aphrodite1]
MNLPEIKQYRFDVRGSARENLVPRELIPASDERSAKIVVPRHAPFFIESVHVYIAGQTVPLNLGEHYDFVSIDHELSEYCGNRVSWVIRKLKDNLPDLEITYQTLGSIPALTATTKYWYEAAALDQRPVWFDQLLNKPSHYMPMLHGHDLAQGFFNFSRLIEVYEDRYETLFGQDALVPYRDWFIAQLNNLKSYVQPYRTLLERYTDNHIEHQRDPHGTRSRAVPGLDQIDEVKTASHLDIEAGNNDRLRVVAAQAHDLINKVGPNPKDHVPPTIVGDYGQHLLPLDGSPSPIPKTTLTVGVKDLMVNAYVDRLGVGRGQQLFTGNDKDVVNNIFNPNPISDDRNPNDNVWINEHIDAGYDLFVAGGNREARLMYNASGNYWDLIIDPINPTDYKTQPDTKIRVTGDMSDVKRYIREWRLIHTEGAVHLIRTVDHETRPTVHWKTITYRSEHGNVGVVRSYTFKYKTINDGTNYTEQGRVILFPRGFSSGRYANGDLVFSDPVELVREDNQILILPAVVEDALYMEFLLPETFRHKGELRRYVHSHMAEVNLDHSKAEMTLTWTDTRPRPYVVTDSLFSKTPDANNYFEQVAVPFPSELTSRRATLVQMSQEGFFGFGYKENSLGEMFAVRITPGEYSIDHTGRKWHLADTGEWAVNRVGGASPINHDHIDVGHLPPMNPYMGVWAESNVRNRYGIVKGIHPEHGMGFFYKNLYGGVNLQTIAGSEVRTSLPLDNIEYVQGLHPSRWIGTVLDESERESEFCWQVASSDGVDRCVPYQVGFSGSQFTVIHYVKVSDEWLAGLGVTENDHWTLLLGRPHDLPDLLFITRVQAGLIKTTVKVLRVSDEVLGRVDGMHDHTTMTTLGADDVPTIIDERTTSHPSPAHVVKEKIGHPNPSMDTNVINVLMGVSGRTTFNLHPNNRFGNESHQLTYPFSLVLNQSNDTIAFFEDEIKDGCVGLSPDLGWVRTSNKAQRMCGGMVNAGQQLGSGYQVNPSYIPVYPGLVGMFNIVPENRHKVYLPIPMDVQVENHLFRVRGLVYDTKQLIVPGSTQRHHLGVVNDPLGPYLEVDSYTTVDEGWLIDVTEQGVTII